MSPNKEKFQPGCQVKQEAEPAAAHREYILCKRLVPITGPEVQIIHIKSLQFYSTIDPKSKSQKERKDQKLRAPPLPRL